jgi:hypothetical protein
VSTEDEIMQSADEDDEKDEFDMQDSFIDSQNHFEDGMQN